jgi:hypothetical protein
MRAIELVVLLLVLINAVVWPALNPWWTSIPWIVVAIVIQRFLVEDR